MQSTSTIAPLEKNKHKPMWVVMEILLIFTILAACNTQNVDQEYLEDPTGFFPRLDNPPGAIRPGGGGGGNSDKRGTAFDLITNLPIEEVHQFYAEQLEAEGWVKLSENFELDLLTSYWDGYTDEGQIWPAILEVSTKPVNPEANYAVELRAVLPP